MSAPGADAVLSNGDRIAVSVALVTRNRSESLSRCLRSWRGQSVQPFEIVISDDSDDQVRPEIQRLAKQFDARWIAGPRKGLYANRNHVALHCRGTHVFSADDDHEHPPGFLEKCLAALREDPNSAWCIGEVNSWDAGPEAWECPGELHLRGVPDAPADHSNSWAWSDGATICPKRVFDSGLRFTEAFRFGAAYLEFGCMVHASGQRIRELENIAVIHHKAEGRSYQIPLEERAADYFAILMLGCVYQRSPENLARVGLYFLKQLVRRPIAVWRSALWAIPEVRRRARWFREWQSKQRPVCESRPSA